MSAEVVEPRYALAGSIGADEAGEPRLMGGLCAGCGVLAAVMELLQSLLVMQ